MSRTRLAFGRLIVATALAAFPFAAFAQHCERPSQCWKNAGEVDGIALELRLRWRNIGVVVLDAANRLQLPETSGEPGIYRFELRRKDDRAQYIGETHNLQRRLYQYRNPGKGQATNHRICAEIRQALASGGSVNVAIADDAWFCAQTACAKADLTSANQRRLLEQLAIFSIPPGVRVLNSERTTVVERSARGGEFSFCS